MLYAAIGIFATTCIVAAVFVIKQRQSARYVTVDWSDEDEPDADVTVVMGNREYF